MASTKSKSSKTPQKKAKQEMKASDKTNEEIDIPNACIKELETLHVNDSSWNCFVALFVEQDSNGTIYTDKFNAAAINGNRLAVRVISMAVIFKTVMKYIAGSEHRLTPMAQLCNAIYKEAGLDLKKNIPTELLGPLIKYIILEYKQWHKKVQEGINMTEKGLEEYHQSIFNVSKANASTGKGSKSEEKHVQSAKKPKSNIKTFTKLRRRGEEWKDVQWIDDSPYDGPNLYIIISTFYDSNLVLELLKLGIPLQTVVKLEKIPKAPRESQNTTYDMKGMFPSLQDSEKRSSLDLSAKNIRGELVDRDQLDKSIFNFWDKLEKLKTNKSSALSYKDIMFLTFIPQHNNITCPMNSLEIDIYKELSDFLYNAFETTKLHKDYLKKMNIVDVTDRNVCLLSDMNVYNSILNNIPHEVVTIPLILDALLIQISSFGSSTVDDKEEEERESVETAYENKINEALQKLIDDLNLQYNISYGQPVNEGSRMSSGSPAENKPLYNIILQHSDDIALKTFHLEKGLANFVVNRTNYIYKSAWKCILNIDCISHITNTKFNKLCEEIINIIYNETSNEDLYYYVYLLIINTVLDSILLQNGTGKDFDTVSTIQNNFEDCKECVKGVSCGAAKHSSYISNNIKFNSEIDKDIISSNMFYIEDMSTEILLQNIQAMHLDYNRLEEIYCPYTDQIILIYHNIPHYYEETWVGKLTTQVPLRDFVEYVLDEERIKLAEEIVPVKQDILFSGNASIYSNFDKDVQQKIKHFSNIDSHFISHRSIKFAAMTEPNKFQKLFAKSSARGSSLYHAEKIKTTPLHHLSLEDPTRKEMARRNKSIPGTEFNEAVEKPKTTFLGYEQGDPMRFQFNGCKKSKILDDNSKVILEIVKKLYGTGGVRLNINICNHNLFYSMNPESKLLIPFHLVLSSGIVIYFGLPDTEISSSKSNSHLDEMTEFKITEEDLKPSVEISEQGLRDAQIESDFESPNNLYTNCFPHDIKDNMYYSIPFIYKLKMSTPSGLHVELKEKHNSLYVRQTQLSTLFVCRNHGPEQFRCCLSSGFILKFFVSGQVLALGASGEIYTIYQKSNSESSHDDILQQIFSDVADNETKIHSEKNDVHTKSDKIKDIVKSHKNSSELHKENINVSNYNSPQHVKEGLPSLLTNSLKYAYSYNYTSPDGKQYDIVDTNYKLQGQLLITTHYDIVNNCIDSDRSDGVRTKHLGDGSLIIEYPDGSRLTSVPVQSEDVFCDWSTEEFIRWFDHSIHDMSTNTTANITMSDRESIIHNNNNNNNEPNNSINSSLKINNESQTQNSLKEEENSVSICECSSNQSSFNKLDYSQDGFVVYNMSYRLEHNNYGLVFYDAKTYQIDFELPQSTKVILKNDGSYEAFFGNASLAVDEHCIYFNKINEKNGELQRTSVINKSTLVRNTYEFAVYDKEDKKNCSASKEKVDLNELLVKDTEVESIKKKSYVNVFFHSKDLFENQIYIDRDLNFHDLSKISELDKITDDDFTCFVVDRDLRGFKIVSSNEVNNYFHYVAERRGLVTESGDAAASTITSIGIERNERDKWLMRDNREPNLKGNWGYTTTTYGAHDSWLHPFREKRESDIRELKMSDVTVVRILKKISTETKIQSYLQRVIKAFKTKEKCTQPLMVPLTKSEEYLNFSDLVQNPDILERIYEEENIKQLKEQDKLRKHMKHIIVRSLVRQACIKSRSLRIKIKDEEIKTALRTKCIPPYYLSCFGLVHDILDGVVNDTIKSIYERVNAIIDNMLTTISKEALKVKSVTAGNKRKISIAENSILPNIPKEEVTQTFTELSHDDIVNSILEKPLCDVTSEEIDLLCHTVEMPPINCPILVNEEFILQDILEARHQFTHNFCNLKSMLDCYRCNEDVYH